MLKKRILILSCLVFSVTLISQVNSYSMAKVENAAKVSITSSENALVGVSEDSKIRATKNIQETVTQILTGSKEEPITESETTSTTTTVEEKNIDFVVTNNMNETIDVIVYLDKINGIKLKYNEVSIRSGECFDDWFDIDENISSGSYDIDVKTKADWGTGSAVIYSKINVKVDEKRDLKVDIKDNTKSDLGIPIPDLTENPSINNDNNEQSNIKELDKEIITELNLVESEGNENLITDGVEASSSINKESEQNIANDLSDNLKNNNNDTEETNTNKIEAEEAIESNSIENSKEINTTYQEEVSPSQSISEAIDQSIISE